MTTDQHALHPADVSQAPTPVAATPRPSEGWTTARGLGMALGGLAIALGLVLSVTGAGVLFVDRGGRSDGGYVMGQLTSYSTPTAAILAPDLEMPSKAPSVLTGPEQLGALRVEVSGAEGEALFVGIGRSDDVSNWLRGTAYDEIDQLGLRRVHSRRDGRSSAPDPATVTWAASRTGTGDFALTWPAEEGRWAVVMMRADGSPGVNVDVRAGATLPQIETLGTMLLVAGVLTLTLGGLTFGINLSNALRR